MQIEATNSSATKELDIVDLLVALECQNLELPKLIK
jgi:hypothetical protein